MTTKRLLMMGICGAMISGVNAEAQERGPRGPRPDGEGRERPPLTEIIQRHDANGDGVLEPSEMPERFPARIMQLLDTNKDGSLSIEEAENGRRMRERGELRNRPPRGEEGDRPERGPRGIQGDRPERGQRDAEGQRPERGPRPEGDPNDFSGDGFSAIVERFDLNGDGALQLDEVPDRMTRMFARMDRNGDGTVDRQEASAMRQQGLRPQNGRDPRGNRPRSIDERSGRRGDRTGIEMMISRNDTNGDGQLDKTEMPERMAPHFDRFDTNGDGVLTPDDTPRRGKVKPAQKGARGKPGIEQSPPE